MTTIEIPTSKSYFEKYNNLVEEKGSRSIASMIERTFSKEHIVKALENGDFSLNSFHLSSWDKMAPFVGWTQKDGNRRFSYLYEQVCLLKHIAIYEIAKCTPKFKD